MRIFAALLAAAFCLAGDAVAAPESDRPLMLSHILKAPLLGEAKRPLIGEQQPEIASVQDVLIAGDGRVEVIFAKDGESTGRIVAWNELVYDAVRNDFKLRAQGSDLERFPPWEAPVSDTQGTAGQILGSKLMDGLVQTPGGEKLGEVKDVQLERDGRLQKVFFRRGQQTATIPWRNVDVQPERPDIVAAPGTEAVIVVDRKKL